MSSNIFTALVMVIKIPSQPYQTSFSSASVQSLMIEMDAWVLNATVFAK